MIFYTVALLEKLINKKFKNGSLCQKRFPSQYIFIIPNALQ